MKRNKYLWFFFTGIILFSALGHDKCTTCPRDAFGHIKRSTAAIRQFKKLHPCPSTGKSKGRCPGYVIDHIVPLYKGGCDCPENMQWQDTGAAKAKDKIE
jgi:hypothetical protein